MSRYRLLPPPAQQAVLPDHCGHARYARNLAVEQHCHWQPVPAPGGGQVVGIDRSVAVSAALSTGELLRVPGLTARQRRHLRHLERKLVSAARNIAAGHPTHLPIPLHSRGGLRAAGPANREPQLLAS